MKYSCLTVNTYQEDKYKIVSLRFQDIMLIKKWRNDQIKVLRQNKILTDEDQINYYHNVIMPSFNANKPNIVLVSFLLKESCIGYGGLTNINWESYRAEISFLLDTQRVINPELYQKDFGIFLTLIKKLAFNNQSFNRLFTETFDIRPLHIDVLEKNGFHLEGRLKQHVFIEGRFVDSLIHGFLKENYHVER